MHTSLAFQRLCEQIHITQVEPAEESPLQPGKPTWIVTLGFGHHSYTTIIGNIPREEITAEEVLGGLIGLLESIDTLAVDDPAVLLFKEGLQTFLGEATDQFIAAYDSPDDPQAAAETVGMAH